MYTQRPMLSISLVTIYALSNNYHTAYNNTEGGQKEEKDIIQLSYSSGSLLSVLQGVY